MACRAILQGRLRRRHSAGVSRLCACLAAAVFCLERASQTSAKLLQARHPHGLSSEPAIATIAKAVLSALSYMHSVGYMHRDVKVSIAEQLAAWLRSHARFLTHCVACSGSKRPHRRGWAGQTGRLWRGLRAAA